MKNLKKYLPFIFFGCLFTFFIIKDAIRVMRLNENHRYSSGLFYRVSSSVDGGPLGEYSFKYKGEIFRGSMTLETKNDIVVGESYLVKFNPENPHICKIFIEKVIPRNIEVPDSGWLSILNIIH